MSYIESPIKIISLLPDPDGTDRNNEKIKIKSNIGFEFIGDIELVDASGNQWIANISLPSNSEKVLTPQSTNFSLNNGGDSVTIKVNGKQIDHVSYTESSSGNWIEF